LDESNATNINCFSCPSSFISCAVATKFSSIAYKFIVGMILIAAMCL
jgi:hypothetical protein